MSNDDSFTLHAKKTLKEKVKKFHLNDARMWSGVLYAVTKSEPYRVFHSAVKKMRLAEARE